MCIYLNFKVFAQTSSLEKWKDQLCTKSGTTKLLWITLSKPATWCHIWESAGPTLLGTHTLLYTSEIQSNQLWTVLVAYFGGYALQDDLGESRKSLIYANFEPSRYCPYPGGGEKWGGNGVGDDLCSYGFDGVYLWTGTRFILCVFFPECKIICFIRKSI